MGSPGRWDVALAGILALGALVRVPFAGWDPHVIADPGLVAEWARHLAAGGLPELLDATGMLTLYPPLATLVLWAIGAIDALIKGAPGGAPTALVLVKVLAIAGDLGLAWLVAHLLAGRAGIIRVAAAGAIALNPALWYTAAIWGQIDSVFVLLMVVGIAAVRGRTTGRGWIAWAAAVLWKLPALTLAPVMAAATFVLAGWRGLLTGLLAAGLLTAATTAALFRNDRVVDYAARLLPGTTKLDVTAFNAWFLIERALSLPAGGASRLSEGTGAAIGVVAVGAVSVVIVAAMLRSPATVGLALPSVAVILGSFLLLTSMRERYLLGAIPFLGLIAAGWEDGRLDRPAAVAFGVLTVTQTLNVIAVGSPAPALWTNVFAAGPTGPLGPAFVALGAGAALANLAVLAWVIRRLVSRGWPRQFGTS